MVKQFEQIWEAMQVASYSGDFRMTAEQEKAALRTLKDALQSGVTLMRTWNGYADLTDRLNTRLHISLRTRRLGSTHAWLLPIVRIYYQASDLPVNCAIALNAIIEESKKTKSCIPDYYRAEAVANELARAIALIGYGENANGLWVELRRYMGLCDA